MDGANRDPRIETRFRELATGTHGGQPHIRHLWAIWKILERFDRKSIGDNSFTLLLSSIHFADLHFTVMREHREFYEYVRWFFEYRLLNTGTNGRMKAELSELYTRNPKKKR